MNSFIFSLERDKGNLHKELMSSKANADKLSVEKAILEKDAKNNHAKLHEAQGLHNGAKDNLNDLNITLLQFSGILPNFSILYFRKLIYFTYLVNLYKDTYVIQYANTVIACKSAFKIDG